MRDLRAFMPMMRPSQQSYHIACQIPCHTARPARSARVFPLVFLALSLAGCAADSPLSLPVPPRADVPEVAHDSYPTIGTTARTGRPALTEPQRAKLQSDLERLSRVNAAKANAAGQATTPSQDNGQAGN